MSEFGSTSGNLRSVTGDLAIDRLCNEFEDAWRASQSPRIEDFLSRADSSVRASLLNELLAIEVFHRQKLGATIDLSEYRSRFPELSEDVLASAVAASGRFDVDPDTVHYEASNTKVSLTPASPPARTAAPERIGDYEILHELARGGMGVVYKAKQSRLDRIVALKMILGGVYADPEMIERFTREATALAQLQHPNIVQIYEVNEHDGQPYFSLEFVEGGSLAQKLSGTPMPPKDAAALVETLAAAIDAAHEKGIIHRDLKPANVLLTKDGTPKITDFGLAKKMEDDGRTRTGAIMGTPSYMAPEQASGLVKELGPLADVYALGAILYEALTGRPPFKGATLLDTLEQVRSTEPVPPSRLQTKCPRDLETICLKCLQKEPSRRYSTALTLAQDLRRFQEGRPIRAQPVSRSEIAWRWCQRNPVVAGLLTVVVILGIAVTIVSVVSAVQSRKSATAPKKERDEKDRERLGAIGARDRARGVLESMVSEESLDQLSRARRLSTPQRQFLESMVSYYREYAAEAPATPEESRRQALAYVQMGKMLQILGKHQDAAESYRVALPIYASLQSSGEMQQLDHRQWGVAHNNLGVVQLKLGEWHQSRIALVEGLRIREQIIAADPKNLTIAAEIAASHSNLAVLMGRMGDLNGKKKELLAAVAIMERVNSLRADNAEFESVLGRLKSNLGELHMNLGEWPDARKQLQDTQQLQAALTKRLPEVHEYAYEYSLTLQNTAVMHRANQNRDAAQQANSNAIRELERLRRDRPSVPEYARELAAAQNMLSELLLAAGDQKGATEMCQAAMKIRQQLVDENPGVVEYLSDLALSYQYYGNILAMGNDAALTRKVRLESLRLFERLVQENPVNSDFAISLGGAYCNFGLDELDRGNLEEGVKQLNKAIHTLEPVHAKNPNDRTARNFLRNSHWARAESLDKLKKHAAAKADWDRTMQLDEGPDTPIIHATHLSSLAKNFRINDAIAETERLLNEKDAPGIVCYAGACVYALAVREQLMKEKGIPTDDAKATIEKQSARALQLLELALTRKYDKITDAIHDGDLASLRKRADFQAFLKKLPTTPKKP